MEQPDESKLTTNHWKGRQWVAFYTNPRAEKQVAQNLKREGFECYLPLVRERHQWSDRMQWVEVPLIASYIFVRLEDKELVQVRNINGIVCAITFGQTRTVARIPDNQMETFMEFVEKAKGVKAMDADKFRKGVKVEVVAGDFKGKQGMLISDEGQDLFGILFEGMSFAIAAVLDVKLLRVVENEAPQPKIKKIKYGNQ